MLVKLDEEKNRIKYGLLHKLKSYRDLAKWAGDKAAVYQKELVEATETGDIFTAPASGWNELPVKAVRVDAKPIKEIDEEKLRHELTPLEWQGITSRVIDSRKLERAVALGEIPLEVYTSCLNYREGRASYYRVEAVTDESDKIEE
jgi:hypothetical protein